MGTTATQSLSSNLSSCPACTYDLTGIATPICPECGVDVIVEQRRREDAHARKLRRARKALSTDALLAVAFFYAAASGLTSKWDRRSLDDYMTPSMTGFVLLVLVWLWRRRRELLCEQRFRFIVPYISIFCWLAWVQLHARRRYLYDVDSVAGAAGLGVMIILTAWLLTPGRVWSVLLLITGSLTTLPGAALMYFDKPSAPADGWSHFSDPRPGQIHDQYPLRWDEARRLGPPIVTGGVVLMVAGLSLRLVQLRKSADTSRTAPQITMTRTPQTDAFWNEFKAATGVAHDDYVVVTFGMKPETRDKLAELTLHGPKRATTSLRRDFEQPGADPFPKPGDLVVVVDGSNTPRCIYRVTQIDVVPFRDVDAAFAWDEGEGDRSLADWTESHRRFFVSQAAEEGFEFHEGVEVVLERFEVVWPANFNLR